MENVARKKIIQVNKDITSIATNDYVDSQIQATKSKTKNSTMQSTFSAS